MALDLLAAGFRHRLSRLGAGRVVAQFKPALGTGEPHNLPSPRTALSADSLLNCPSRPRRKLSLPLCRGTRRDPSAVVSQETEKPLDKQQGDSVSKNLEVLKAKAI